MNDTVTTLSHFDTIR